MKLKINKIIDKLREADKKANNFRRARELSAKITRNLVNQCYHYSEQHKLIFKYHYCPLFENERYSYSHVHSAINNITALHSSEAFVLKSKKSTKSGRKKVAHKWGRCDAWFVYRRIVFLMEIKTCKYSMRTKNQSDKQLAAWRGLKNQITKTLTGDRNGCVRFGVFPVVIYGKSSYSITDIKERVISMNNEMKPDADIVYCWHLPNGFQLQDDVDDGYRLYAIAFFFIFKRGKDGLI